jgi:hypothetical protein
MGDFILIFVRRPQYGCLALAGLIVAIFGGLNLFATAIDNAIYGPGREAGINQQNITIMELERKIQSGYPPVDFQVTMGDCQGCKYMNNSQPYLIFTVTNNWQYPIQASDVVYPDSTTIPTCEYQPSNRVESSKNLFVYCSIYENASYNKLSIQNQLCLEIKYETTDRQELIGKTVDSNLCANADTSTAPPTFNKVSNAPQEAQVHVQVSLGPCGLSDNCSWGGSNKEYLVISISSLWTYDVLIDTVDYDIETYKPLVCFDEEGMFEWRTMKSGETLQVYCDPDPTELPEPVPNQVCLGMIFTYGTNDTAERRNMCLDIPK